MFEDPRQRFNNGGGGLLQTLMQRFMQQRPNHGPGGWFANGGGNIGAGNNGANSWMRGLQAGGSDGEAQTPRIGGPGPTHTGSYGPTGYGDATRMDRRPGPGVDSAG